MNVSKKMSRFKMRRNLSLTKTTDFLDFKVLKFPYHKKTRRIHNGSRKTDAYTMAAQNQTHTQRQQKARRIQNDSRKPDAYTIAPENQTHT